MTNDDFHWSYGIVNEDGGMDAFRIKGVAPADKIREVVGGDYELTTLPDQTTVAHRKDETGLEENTMFRQFKGKLVLGKLSGGEYVGVLGTPAPR